MSSRPRSAAPTGALVRRIAVAPTARPRDAAIAARLRRDVRPSRRAPCCATRRRPDVIQAGVKYNVIPGDRRDPGRLPDAARAPTEPAMRAELSAARRRGARGRVATSSVFGAGRPSTRRIDTELYRTSRRPSATTIPMACRSRSWPRSPRMPSTPIRLGIPTYGFSPLRLEPERAVPRPVPRGRRAGRRRCAAVRPAGPLRRGSALLRLTPAGVRRPRSEPCAAAVTRRTAFRQSTGRR